MNSIVRIFLVTLVVVAGVGVKAESSADGIWMHVNETQIATRAERQIKPDRYQTLRLDRAAFEQQLRGGSGKISLPLADGSYQAYNIVAAPVMPKELAQKYPEIRTWAGEPVDGTAGWARLDLTPAGFHGMIRTPGSTVFIDPYQIDRGQVVGDEYIVYDKADYTNHADHSYQCGVHERNDVTAKDGQNFRTPAGSTLRTYRTAVATTGEYTSFHGGTVPSGLAAVVTAINRVTGIYETEFSVRLELIPNNDQLIFTNSATDGYTNNDGFTMLGQNQAKLDAVIGSGNYDVGHVFSTGGGGIAGLGVVCRGGNKARGVTGLGSPIGDPFYVDFVAHEFGHQFGANHTFNGTASSCGGGNRNGSTAYEPGSGSTIMAYSGICGSHNIANLSDPYFHTASFDEVVAYTNFSFGNNCADTTATGNSAPVVDAGSSHTVPANTPLRLTGSATDPNGDELVYRWEQFDLGPGGAPSSPSGNAPIFRSFEATDDSTRLLPKLANILGDFQSTGELMASYSRDLRFRLTALDNRPLGGGVDYDVVQHTVVDTGARFEITSQNSATSWPGGTQQTVTWNVANTDAAPILCSEVDIHLSTNTGATFDVLLAGNTPNDGAEDIVVPESPSNSGRVKVECSDNIFFDINNTNIALLPAPNPDFTVNPDIASVDVCAPDNGIVGVEVFSIGSFTGDVSLSVTGEPAGTTAVFSPNPVPGGGNTTLTVGNTAAATSGAYTLQLSGTGAPGTRTADVDLNLAAQLAAVTDLESPADAAIAVILTPTLTWSPAADAAVYLVEIATDTGFANIVESASLTATSYDVQTTLNESSIYFWRVTAQNACGGAVSTMFSFTTVSPAGTYCSAPVLPIPDNSPAGVSDILTITDAGSVIDLNVSLNISHPYIGNLKAILTNQTSGTTIEFMDKPGFEFLQDGCPFGDIDGSLDDEAAQSVGFACDLGAAALSGSWIPTAPLSGFDSESFTGNWTMQIVDSVSGDSGMLNQWCVDIVAGPPVVGDTDNDGLNDNVDNCTLVENPSQLDTDNDGYGNPCDADLNNDMVVNFFDLIQFQDEFLSLNLASDFNEDGVTNFFDLLIFIDAFLTIPGPSGVAP